MKAHDRGWTDEDVPRLDGKRVIVTGANSGLGWETSRAMLARGATVVLACRDKKRGEDAVARLVAQGVGERAVLELLDLGSLSSIRDFADRERGSNAPLDIVVANAGLMAIPERKTADGFEMTMGVNHLGHFALVGLLMDKLMAAAEGRVVTVSSQYHRQGKLELFDDLFFEKKPYHRWVAYQQSKLANLLFAFELARRIDQKGLRMRSLGAHPGYAATELQGHGAQMGAPAWEGFFMRIGNALFAQSQRAGAWPQLRAATDPEAKNGEYYGPRDFNEIRGHAVRVEASRRAHDVEAAQRLWARSSELTNVTYPV